MNLLEKFIAYFVKRHLLTNLIFIVVFVGGVVAWNSTSKEEMPDIEFDRAYVSTHYPGATATEVEHFVTKPLEDLIKGLDGVYRVTSNSSDGSSSIGIDFEQNYPKMDETITELRNVVLDVRLPDDVDDPTVHVWETTKKAIIDVAVYDSSRHLLDKESRKRLQSFVYNLEQQLLSLPQVNSVERSGYLKEEIEISVDPAKLRKYEIPLNSVISEIRSSHIRQPAGKIDIKNEPKVTLLSELDSVDKLNELVIQGGFEGQMVELQDIARIESKFNSSKSITKVNGHEAVIIRVVKNTTYGIMDAVNAVKNKVNSFKSNNLKGKSIELVTLDDESIDLKNRLSIVLSNGTIGFILILVMLFIFLDFRSGIWVAFGIPFTLCFSMIFTSISGYTINNVTLAAVIIVLGMIVDDAIVVSENITRLRAEGMEDEKSAIVGTAFVFNPIIASILTTCIAFLPLMFFEGRFGEMLKFIPPIIFFMLGASLFESLFILPGHMNLRFSLLSWISSRFGSKEIKKKKAHWFMKVEDRYGNFLKKILPYKWVILPIFGLLLIFALYIVKSKMKFVMFPREETRQIIITGAASDPTADRYDTARISKKVEDKLKPYINDIIIGMRSRVAQNRWGRSVGENNFRMNIEIVPKEERDISADQIVKEWEDHLSATEGLKDLRISKSRWGHSSGAAIELEVQENNDALRAEVAGLVENAMKNYPELENVEIDRPVLNNEYKITLIRNKIKRLSINPSNIASTLRASLQGIVLYEIPTSGEEIDVRLTTIESSRDDIDKILDMPIENRGNYLVPLRDIVEVEDKVTPNAIERKDSRRITTVYADIKKGTKASPLEIAEYFEKNVFPDILSAHPSTILNFEGEIKDTRESKGDFTNAIIMAVVLIYIVLILLFNSLTKPLIIMLAIPFGIIGVVFAFWLHGKTLFGFFAAIGAVGLAGVVVNDSIIMLAKLNKFYDDKMNHDNNNEQIASIAKTRLRAVLLTTLTTVAGLIPTAYGFTGYDSMLAEMMLALTWGLIFGTLITLLMVPCAYSIGKDFGMFRDRLFYNKNV